MIKVSAGKKREFVHVPVTETLNKNWAAFWKKHGMAILARDTRAIGRGLNAREYTMERALTEYMANHRGGK